MIGVADFLESPERCTAPADVALADEFHTGQFFRSVLTVPAAAAA